MPVCVDATLPPPQPWFLRSWWSRCPGTHDSLSRPGQWLGDTQSQETRSFTSTFDICFHLQRLSGAVRSHCDAWQSAAMRSCVTRRAGAAKQLKRVPAMNMTLAAGRAGRAMAHALLDD